jgi:hypothetical protein
VHFSARFSFRVFGIALLAILASSSRLAAQTVAWNANPETDVTGYIVQYGTQSGSPSSSIDVGNVTSRPFTGLQAGTTYYFRVVAYNSAGLQSQPSAQVSHTVPAQPSPTITGVSPASGPAVGGTLITITGSNFVTGGVVRVGGTLATGIVLLSSTQVQALTPLGTAGARDVQVVNPSGLAAALTGGFTYTAAAPTLTSVSPTSGPTAGGTTITLTGTGFVSGATVRVGGVAATNVVFVSSTSVTARTPAGTAGARDVQITNPNGQSATRTGGFTYTTSTTLTLTAVSPSSGPTSGGTFVTLTGTNFVRGAWILIGGNLSTDAIFVNSTTITLRTPAGTVGAKDVRLNNGDGRSVTLAGGFTYTSGSSLTQQTAFTSFLAEGAQTGEMRTQLAIANPETTDAAVKLTFMDANGAATEVDMTVPARSRQTVDASSVPQLAGTTFSTRIDSDQPVAVDRLVALDAEGRSASLEAAVTQPSATWYFAEGSTADPMELFYLVQNPGKEPADVQVRYLLPGGAAPVTRTYTVAAGSRATIWVDREDAAIASTDVAAEITSTTGAPIVVERSVYLKQPGSAQPRGGDSTSGATAAATSWFLEGATGRYATRLLLANPGSTPVDVHVTYQREDGGSVVRAHRLDAASRQSIDVAREDAALANATLGITVEASAPIVAERTKVWGANGDAVSGAGASSAAARWLLAEAELGGARDARTDVVLFNHGGKTDVTVTLLFEDGPEVAETFTVGAGARLAVPMAEAFPAATGRRFSVLVEAADPAASLTVDRAIFWRAADGSRTAGADGAASRLH